MAELNYTSRWRAIVLGVAALFLLFAARASSGETEDRKDSLGDPLPAAAQVRYGSSRLRHEQPVQAVALSPDGRYIASSARDFTIRIWDRATGALVHSLLTPTNRLAFGAPESSTPCLRYSPNGKFLVAGRGDAKLLIWEAPGYKLVHTLSGSTGPIQVLAIAPDNKTCASADSEQIVRIWDLGTGKETKQFTVQERAVALAFTADGAQLIAGCGDGGVRIWQTEPLNHTRVIDAHDSAIQHLALAPGGAVLASVGLEKQVRFWDVRPEFNPQITPLYWTMLPGARLSAIAALYQSLHYFALVREVDKFTCNEEPVRELAYLPNGTLVTGGRDGLTIWNVKNHKEVRRVPTGAVNCLAFDSSGSVGVTGDNNGAVRLWNMESGQEIIVTPGPVTPPSEIAVTPVGAQVEIAYQGGSVLLWDSAGGVNGKTVGAASVPVPIGAISADGSLAATLSPEGITISELPSGIKRIAISTPPKNILALAVNGPGKLVAAATEDKSVLIWSLADGQLLQQLDGGSSPLRTMMFTTDGKTLAACAGKDTLVLWDVTTGKELRRLVESGAEILSAALSPDGTIAAVGHPEGAVRIWHTGTGRLIHLLEGHPGPVRALAFSPDGRALAAGSWLTLRLWEVVSGKERLRLFDLPGEVTAAAITPGGETVLLGMSSTQSLLVSLDPAGLEGKGWNAAELEGLWKDLESADAGRAYRTISALSAKPGVAVPLIRERLHQLAPLDDAQRRRQAEALQKLESVRFEEREKAGQELEQLADAAEPALRSALAQNPNSELRFQLLALLDKLQSPERQSQRLRGLRCCELLERIANPEARKVLQDLAAGAPETWLTAAAKSSLSRTSGGLGARRSPSK
jgi:WD40 repeat protein